MQRAQKTIDEFPYDLEAWSLLIREAQNRPVAEVRPVFEKLVTVFPSAGRYWKIYIEHEVSYNKLINHVNIFLTLFDLLTKKKRQVDKKSNYFVTDEISQL